MKKLRKQFDDLFYVDEDHEDNFLKVCKKWTPQTYAGNEEFLSACYILATPIIFTKLKNKWETYDNPTDWIWHYENGLLDLSSGMRHLGILSRHLFNYEHEFDLMNCLAVLDVEHFHVMLEAICIRKFGVELPPRLDRYV